jgi:hypothetical protein
VTRRADPPADELRDPRRAAPWARAAGFRQTRAWRWHCEAWPDAAVSRTSWRRYWHA